MSDSWGHVGRQYRRSPVKVQVVRLRLHRPRLQYADVEHELAYLQAFDTVGTDFFDAYTAQTPMRPGFEIRRLFYGLNTHMIHV